MELDGNYQHSQEMYLLIPIISQMCVQAVELREPLTVAGELSKLPENIAIGRDWGGVHYSSLQTTTNRWY